MAISVSGSKARLSILLVANLLLLGLGIALIALGSILIGSYLLNHLSFASGLFHATPILIIIAGIATVIVSMYGLVLWKRQQEISSGLRFFSILLFLAFLLCVIACILSFLLREVAAVHFPSTNVLAQIRRFFNDEDIQTRWNALQRGYECCGGHQQGYRDWTPNSGILRAVPDSCCKLEFEHCGERVNFNQELAIPRVDSVIHVKGCMPVIKSAMRNKVLPILMACALMALVAGLIELLLMLCAYCFADHVKKIKDVRRSQMSLERGQTPPWRNPSPRLKVPVLDASPSLKQNRFFFQNQSDSPEPPSQIEGSLDESSSHYARIHSPENKKSGWFSNCFGKKKTPTAEPRTEMDPMHRRKEALYNDALDREHTLMGVLKNVSAPPSEINDEDQVETAPTAHPPPTKKGFSFFGFRSKSRDNVLSSDSKLNKNQGDPSTTSQQVRDMKALSLDNLHKKDSDTSRGFFAFFSKSKERLHEDGNKRRRNSDTPKGGSHLKERSQSHDEMRSNQQKLKLPSWLSSQPKRGDTVDDRPGDIDPGFDEVDLKTPEANVETKKDEANGLKKLRSKWVFQPKTSTKQDDRDGNPLVEEDHQKSDRFGDTSKAIISRGVSPALADRIETLEVEHENEEDEEVESVVDPPVTTVDVSTSPKESRKLGTPSWLLARGQSVDALDRNNHIEQEKREEDTLQSSSISLPHRKPTVIGSNEDILDYVNRRPSVGKPVRVESPLDKNLTSDEWEGDSRVRLSGFGLNKLEGSRRESQTRSPNSRPVLASDDERISQIDMEIDTNKKSPKKKVSYAEDTPKLDSDELPNVIRPTPKKSKSYLKIKMPTFGRQSQTKAHDSPTPEHETDRRELASQVTSSGGIQQSDHDFMKHINKSGYYGDTKLPTPLVEGKWKEDKVARVHMSNPYAGNWSEMDEKSPHYATDVEGTKYQTPPSLTKDPSRRRSGPYSAVYEDRQTPSHAKTGTQSKQGRRASESSISSGSSSSNGSRSPADDDPNRKVDLAKLKSPQFYLDKKDGRILAAFETEPQKKRRGRSVDHLDQGDDDMYLPFGTTEYWIHEVDKKLEENEKHQRIRTRSEPRISKRSDRRTSRDEVQSDRDRGIQSSDRFGRTKRRVIPHGPKGEPVRNIKSLDRNRGRDFRYNDEFQSHF
ncbi:hypothetical protein TCAL_01988 [Tigriopus californicus]|uniref:Tetraspanin n=1 Tax=Tigriopus californicus TaxID=6832 RepID=A0A553PPV2_TIGCA|nr:hypothetical protein TCAL_01988 [Tigriopus californicus]